MTRFLGYVSMSLDGRIADETGQMDWLSDHGAAPGEGDRGYGAFFGAADAVIMGRVTHDYLRSAGDWPFEGKPVYVVTSRPLDPGKLRIVPVLPDLPGLKAGLEAERHRRVWVMGGAQMLGSAAEAGLLDELQLFIMPVVLGRGVPLFEAARPPRAALIGHRLWPGGCVELTYAFSRQDR